jgi:cell division septal protein FtsQ
MKDIPTSPRIIEIRHNRRVRKIRLLILCFILLISIIGFLSYFSSNNNIVIDKVVVNGTHVIDHEEVEKEVFKNLSGKYLYLFSKSDGFIYPHNHIYNDLILKFPRIESLSVNRDNLKTININITERKGSYLYCGAIIPENKDDVGENCYFINNDGFIFDKAPYFSGNVYFKYYMALGDGITDPLGKQMVSIDRFHELARFIDSVTTIGFKPIYIALDSDGVYSLYLNHGVDSTLPKIMFKNDNDLKTIEDNFSLAMKKKEFADEINSKYNTLLYIDLRFKNKVLYKFQ